MARGKAMTKKSRTILEDLDAEDSAKKRSIFGDTDAEDTNRRVASDDEDSAGYQDYDDISMKKQGAGTVYYMTPANRGRWEPHAPAYITKRNQRDIYANKGDDSLDKQEQ